MSKKKAIPTIPGDDHKRHYFYVINNKTGKRRRLHLVSFWRKGYTKTISTPGRRIWKPIPVNMDDLGFKKGYTWEIPGESDKPGFYEEIKDFPWAKRFKKPSTFPKKRKYASPSPDMASKEDSEVFPPPKRKNIPKKRRVLQPGEEVIPALEMRPARRAAAVAAGQRISNQTGVAQTQFRRNLQNIFD